MAFVSEKLTELDREWLNSFQLKDPFNKQPVQLRRWTIDRERNAFLVGLGGQGFYGSEIPLIFALVWKNNVIYMDTFQNGDGDISTGIEMFWKITKIEAPGSLIKDHTELMELIKDAFDAEGFAGRRNCVTKVNFEYLVDPVFIIREV